MPRVEKERRVIVPYGDTSTFSVYINETLYDSIFNINVQKYLDKVWIFDAIVPGSNKSDSNLLRGNTVKIFIENEIFLKGTIESSKYNTNNSVKIKGIGYVAYKLREKTVKQNEENKSYYNAKTSAYVIDHLCSENLDGSSPWIVTTNHVDTYPSIYVRMDNENRLTGIMGTAKACNYNWYESWGSFPWKTDHVMNIAENKGSPTSTHTFEVSGDSQNSVGTDREEDKDRLYNDITVLGYGDGVNQLRSKNFHATTNRTYLTADMTEDGTETINVADTTGFPSSGNVWIGCEKVTYTGKTGTTLTGITREAAFMDGTNVTEAYLHTKYIEVYDAQYTTTSAQTDSSIGDGTELNDANWGIQEKTFTDNSIIKQDILDKIAQYLVAEHKDIVITVEIEPMEIYETMDNITLGDIVTVNDPDAGSSNEEFRLIGIELGLKDAMTYIKVVCSTLYRNIGEILRNVESESKKLSVYMQGAPNVISVQSYENAQYSATPEDKAMKMKFRVWDKTIAIQNARLDFKILPFRGYVNASQTSAGGSESAKTSEANTEFGTANVNVASNWGTLSNLAYNTWTQIGSSYTPSSDGQEEYIIFNVTCTDADGQGVPPKSSIFVKVTDTTSSIDYPDSDGVWMGFPLENETVGGMINIPKNVDGKTLVVKMKHKVVGGSQDFEMSMNYFGDGEHTHNVNLSTHTHAITMAHGIFEDSDNPTVKVQIGDDDDWAATKGYINSGAAYSYGTHNNIDISSELKDLMGDLSSTKRIRIQFEPQGSGNTCRIEANADIFVFLGSV